jgi:hypothetical protein
MIDDLVGIQARQLRPVNFHRGTQASKAGTQQDEVKPRIHANERQLTQLSDRSSLRVGETSRFASIRVHSWLEYASRGNKILTDSSTERVFYEALKGLEGNRTWALYHSALTHVKLVAPGNRSHMVVLVSR